jgi:hypothetical protein
VNNNAFLPSIIINSWYNDSLDCITDWVSGISCTCDNRRRSIHLNGLLRVSHYLHKVKPISVHPKTEDVALHDRRAQVKATIGHRVLRDTSRVILRVAVVAYGRNHAWNSVLTAIISAYDSNCFDGGCVGEGDLPPGSIGRKILRMNHIGKVPIIIDRGIRCRHFNVLPITSANCWRTQAVPIKVSHFW